MSLGPVAKLATEGAENSWMVLAMFMKRGNYDLTIKT
jgi:hypothetical protein